MSNRPHRRRRTNRPNPTMTAAATLAARAIGCTCSPDVTRTHPGATGPVRVEVAHDDGCPAVNAPTQTVILLEETP